MALGIDGAFDGTPLLDPDGAVTLSPPDEVPDDTSVRSGPRVGVNGGADTPWRFWLDGDPTVSRYRRNSRSHP